MLSLLDVHTLAMVAGDRLSNYSGPLKGPQRLAPKGSPEIGSVLEDGSSQ